MTGDIRTAESVFLAGKAKYMRWRTKFLKGWYQPLWDRMAVQVWEGLTPEAKERLRQRIGDEAFAEAERTVARLRRSL